MWGFEQIGALFGSPYNKMIIPGGLLWGGNPLIETRILAAGQYKPLECREGMPMHLKKAYWALLGAHYPVCIYIYLYHMLSNLLSIL